MNLEKASTQKADKKAKCSAIYRGDSFDDKKYNELLSHVQSAIV